MHVAYGGDPEEHGVGEGSRLINVHMAIYETGQQGVLGSVYHNGPAVRRRDGLRRYLSYSVILHEHRAVWHFFLAVEYTNIAKEQR